MLRYDDGGYGDGENGFTAPGANEIMTNTRNSVVEATASGTFISDENGEALFLFRKISSNHVHLSGISIALACSSGNINVLTVFFCSTFNTFSTHLFCFVWKKFSPQIHLLYLNDTNNYPIKCIKSRLGAFYLWFT